MLEDEIMSLTIEIVDITSSTIDVDSQGCSYRWIGGEWAKRQFSYVKCQDPNK